MSDFEAKAVPAGTYNVLGFLHGYFMNEHDEALPVHVQGGRVVLPEDAVFCGNPGTRFERVQREGKRTSVMPSLINPDMPRPLTPEQAAMRQLQARMAQMQIALERREVMTPAQIERAVAPAETVVEETSQPDPEGEATDEAPAE